METVLGRSVHHKAILRLENSEKRGQPDILHTCLKIVSDSPVYRSETRRDSAHRRRKMDYPEGRIRFPVTYGNFIGLMEKLLSKDRILDPDGKILMETASKKDALRLLDAYARRILFTHVDRRVEIRDYVKSVPEESVSVCFLIGAYLKGRPSRKYGAWRGRRFQFTTRF